MATNAGPEPTARAQLYEEPPELLFGEEDPDDHMPPLIKEEMELEDDPLDFADTSDDDSADEAPTPLTSIILSKGGDGFPAEQLRRWQAAEQKLNIKSTPATTKQATKWRDAIGHLPTANEVFPAASALLGRSANHVFQLGEHGLGYCRKEVRRAPLM